MGKENLEKRLSNTILAKSHLLKIKTNPQLILLYMNTRKIPHVYDAIREIDLELEILESKEKLLVKKLKEVKE